MKGENLTYWKWLLAQRQKDLELELVRDLVDDNLLRVIRQSIFEATQNINELENV